MAYVNPALVDPQAFTSVQRGFRVDKAAAGLPATTVASLFTIAGGRVVILGIVGEVATTIQTIANATKLIANPTTGVDTDLCATLDISAKAVATLFGITGIFADALVGSGGGATILLQRPVVVAIGAIELSCAGTATGTVKWTCYYVPLDEGATLVSA